MSPDPKLAEDLAVFADIGTDPPRSQRHEHGDSFTFVRSGHITTITLLNDGRIVERVDGHEAAYLSVRALLASTRYANLKDWARVQYRLLSTALAGNTLIELSGHYTTSSSTQQDSALRLLDAVLSPPGGNLPSPSVLILDGPAGIGKTFLIQRLAADRARAFPKEQKPLVLHVTSRGRILSYLTDLIAYSLQTMRVNVTYDQIPTLVRRGLVQLAIDGFDELGDPNGYDTAWGQLRDFLKQISGAGTVILAGRETFLGYERLEKALPAAAESSRGIGVLSLDPIEPDVAQKWLTSNAWTDDRIKRAERWGLFDRGSYVLRPFFLQRLLALNAEIDTDNRPPLLLLIHAMIRRESEPDRLPTEISSSLTREECEQLLIAILEEVAREIADSEANSIHLDTLNFLVHFALNDRRFDEDTLNALANRSMALAFLVRDDREDYRSFSHSEFLNYFLARVVVRGLVRDDPEIPKFLGRTIIGSDFLAVFTLIVEANDILAPELRTRYGTHLLRFLAGASVFARKERNLGALLLACGAIWRSFGIDEIGPLAVDEAVMYFKPQPLRLRDVSINQLDARGADLGELDFIGCTIGTLIADEATRVGANFPEVGLIQLRRGSQQKALVGQKASIWLDEHGRKLQATASISTASVSGHSNFVRLLERFARAMQRQHWIREGSDDPASAITQDADWRELRSILESRNLLTVEHRQAAGTRSAFLHLRRSREILGLEKMRKDIRELVSELTAKRL